MDFGITWTESAISDLRGIVRYIARDNRAAAERLGLLMISKVDSLGKFPRIGHRVPEFALESIRQISGPRIGLFTRSTTGTPPFRCCGFGMARVIAWMNLR